MCLKNIVVGGEEGYLLKIAQITAFAILLSLTVKTKDEIGTVMRRSAYYQKFH